ncbi:hypothetical protein RCL_jg9230.t1 [Rhizophagus clarus]|uniref:Uncharacterized protein n=1 Tax=Rhizophagus clarus TaxID=94130 RepID=A0A8H3R3T6_9GLOM|nr:hypothetical protein RCL_jg9230.t1 [Rhizophagus clarus]
MTEENKTGKEGSTVTPSDDAIIPLSNDDKVEYLTLVRDEVQEGTRIYRKLGSSIIKLMANVAVTCAVITLLISSSNSKNDNNAVASNSAIYFIQYVNILLDLIWQIGFFNKKFLYYFIGVTVISGVSGAIAAVLITTETIEETSAISIIGPGILFSDWISKFAHA